MARLLFATALAGATAKERRTKLPALVTLSEHAALSQLTGFAHVKLDDAEPRMLQKRAAKLASKMGCAHAEPQRIFRHAGKHEAEHKAFGLHRWFKLTCSDARERAERREGEAVARAIGKLLVEPSMSSVFDGVEVVNAGYKISPTYEPDDPMLPSQAHYAATHLSEALDLIPGGNPAVVVQVIDSGLDLSHPEFTPGLNVWVNAGEADCDDGIDNDGNGFVDDCYGYNHADGRGDSLLGDGSHGTHCSGTIGAATDNGVGVAGVGSGLGGAPGTKIMTSVAFGETTIGGFAEALVYGADEGARVSSNSWGYSVPDVYDQDVLDGIDYAVAKGVIVIFAAGNGSSEGAHHPGYYASTVAVAALDDSGVRAFFSNYGDWVDISGPGVDILSTKAVADGSYGTMSGTSMACPHVAGLLALGIGANPGLSNADTLDCLYGSAADVDSINGADYTGKLGAGMIDARAFAECMVYGVPSHEPTVSPAPTMEPTTASPSVSPAPTEHGCGPCDMELTVTVTTDGFPGETSWELTMVDTSEGCRSDSHTVGGGYTDMKAEYTTVISTLCEYKEYEFAITDSWGDGSCCEWGSGGYELAIGDEAVFYVSDGTYGEGETVVFHASLDPMASTTTSAPTTTSPAPTERCAAGEAPATMYMYDSSGDGWNGNTFEIRDANGTVAAEGTLVGGSVASQDLCLDPTLCYTLYVIDGGSRASEVSIEFGDMTSGAPFASAFGFVEDGTPSSTVCSPTPEPTAALSATPTAIPSATPAPTVAPDSTSATSAPTPTPTVAPGSTRGALTPSPTPPAPTNVPTAGEDATLPSPLTQRPTRRPTYAPTYAPTTAPGVTPASKGKKKKNNKKKRN